MVTIQLQPFLPYTNLALKNSYWTEIRLQISFNIAKDVIDVDELDEDNLSAATGKQNK